MPKPGFKRRLLRPLKYALAAGVMAYLVHAGKLRWSDAHLDARNLPWIGAGLILLGLVMAVSALRYWLLLTAVGIRLSRVEATRVVLVSGLFNNFMLGSVGGDVVKVVYILPASPSRAAAISTVMVERLLGVLGMITIGGTSLLLGWHEAMATPGLYRLAILVFGVLYGVILSAVTGTTSLAKGRAIGVGVWLLLSSATALGVSLLVSLQPPSLITSARHTHLAVLIWPLLAFDIGAALACVLVVPGFEPGKKLASILQEKIPLGGKVVALAQSLLSYRLRLATLAAAFALSVAIQLLNVLALYQFAKAVPAGAQVSVAHVLFAGPLAFIANMLPVPGGGLGVGEAAFGELLELCRSGQGTPIVGGAAMFLSYRVWNLLVSLAGLPVYLWGGAGLGYRTVAAPVATDVDGLPPASATAQSTVDRPPVPAPHSAVRERQWGNASTRAIRPKQP